MENFEAVFTSEMEYPVGMTDEQAEAIYKAFEMRRVAHELAYQLNESEREWVEHALIAIQTGDITYEELFDAVWSAWWDDDQEFEPCFANAFNDML